MSSYGDELENFDVSNPKSPNKISFLGTEIPSFPFPSLVKISINRSFVFLSIAWTSSSNCEFGASFLPIILSKSDTYPINRS